jgi:hypothetical protein
MSEEIEETEMDIDGPMPQCALCKNLSSERGKLKCPAFPNGIPERILQNKVDHREPVDGDNGIQFEPLELVTTQMVDDLFE